MRISIIGSSGHYGYVLAGMREGDSLVAIAPGTQGEDMTSLRKALEAQGLSPRFYGDYRALLDQEKPDVAGINPWFCDTAAVTCEALSRGIHAFAEKPLATDFTQLARVSEAAKGEAKLTAMFGIRGDPWFQAAYEAVQGGALGDIRLAHGQKSYKMGGKRGPVYQHRQTSGGLIPWVAIHAIDWIAWMTGLKYLEVSAVQSAQGNQENGELECSSAMLFRMEGDCAALVQADFLRPAAAARHDDDALRLTGTKGTLVVRDKRALLEAFDAPVRELALPPARSLFRDFLTEIEGGAPCGLTGEAAIAMTAAALHARDAADLGQTQRIG